MRRRVIWLVSQWIGVKLSVTLRPTLYEAILPLLQDDEDLVVRLEAANTLRTDILTTELEYFTKEIIFWT